VAVERKHSGGAQVVRNGPSSPLCSDPPVSVLLFFSKVSPPVLFFWLQFFCSFTLLGLPSQTVLSRSFSLFLLTPKTSLLSRSLFPPFSILFFFLSRLSSSIYKQEERELPPALSHRGAGGNWATLPLQGKVMAFTGHGAHFLAGYGFIGMGLVQVGG